MMKNKTVLKLVEKDKNNSLAQYPVARKANKANNKNRGFIVKK